MKVDMVDDMVAEMVAEMVADIVAHMVADVVADMEVDKVADMEVEKVGHTAWALEGREIRSQACPKVPRPARGSSNKKSGPRGPLDFY